MNATTQIRADQCYPGAVLVQNGARQIVTKLFVTKLDYENPNASIVVIETAAGRVEHVANARVDIEDVK